MCSYARGKDWAMGCGQANGGRDGARKGIEPVWANFFEQWFGYSEECAGQVSGPLLTFVSTSILFLCTLERRRNVGANDV
mmetsp:Transcript_43484/g.170081  ORF Transcript_43484/g.170081 Transcript_43484/m.170081 type:complete len:80 (+) Transcript_43484:1476-1715(+)